MDREDTADQRQRSINSAPETSTVPLRLFLYRSASAGGVVQPVRVIPVFHAVGVVPIPSV